MIGVIMALGKTFLFKSFMLIPIVFIIFNCLHLSKCEKVKLAGHLKKLGSHIEPRGITWAGVFSSPFVFYQNFVEPGSPLLMREVLQQVNHPGLVNWTDSFLSSKFGNELVEVEQSKVENREISSSWISFKEFLKIYQTENVYMVNSLNKKFEDLVLIPSTLQCGGFQNTIQEAVLWMGSHRTSSVLHRDSMDNLLCVLNGRKNVVLIDKSYKDDVESDGFDRIRGFSKVDPQRVDFNKFPRLSQVLWHKAELNKGDCLFIPQGWYHQVVSSGYRHLGINLWFSHLWWFNTSNCKFDISVHKPLEPISTFGFASPNEAYRSKLLSNFKDKGLLSRYRFHELLPNHPTERRAEEFFDAINKYPDGALSWSELYTFNIDEMLVKFPDLFDIPGVKLIPTEVNEYNDILSDETDSSIEFDYNDIDNLVSDDESIIINSFHVKADNSQSEEGSLPLPDAVSGQTPALPDDSINNQCSSPSHHDELGDKECQNKLNSKEENGKEHQTLYFGEDYSQSDVISKSSDTPNSFPGGSTGIKNVNSAEQGDNNDDLSEEENIPSLKYEL